MSDSQQELIVERGGCRALFAYDLGRSADLEACDRRITAMKTRAMIRHRRSGRSAPSAFQHGSLPLRISQQSEAISVGDYQTDSVVELVLYEFGSVSVGYRIDIRGSFDKLSELSEGLYENEVLRTDSRRRVEQLLDVIRPDVEAPEVSVIVEDYVIYEIHSVSPHVSVQELCDKHGPRIAQILRSEQEPLSRDEIDDAHACRISFGPGDLTLIDWNAAIVFDEEAEDVLAVLEFANTQLMEMRSLDRRLDRDMDAAYEVLQGSKRPYLYLPGISALALRRIAEMQADNAILFEALNNSLKLIGDQYLARVYRLASRRFHLAEWDGSIVRKLETLDSIYQKMSDRGAALRMELLEWVIILLIAASIVISLMPGHSKP
ncbi:MAG: hypothetical protein JXQ73_33930 [Phycisphaerae bacterium]|nr:hypothetical protein [Phycisphaerae bacterium]